MTKEEKEAEQNDTLILGNIPHSQRKGISREWLLVWEQIEIWYGDPKQTETAAQLLTRLQEKFQLTPKT